MTKILIIEDDKTLQKAMRCAFEQDNFQVYQEYDGERGLLEAKNQKPDVILLDLLLPKKDGWKVLEEIRRDAEIKKTPILVMSVVGGENSILRCADLNIEGYILKSRHHLQEVVERIKGITE